MLESNAADSFQFTPYMMHWIPNPDSPDKSECIYGETYTLDAMIQAQIDIDKLP